MFNFYDTGRWPFLDEKSFSTSLSAHCGVRILSWRDYTYLAFRRIEGSLFKPNREFKAISRG